MREVHTHFRSSFQKTPASPIWRNDFGAKNGAQAKQRVEAYLTYARVNRRYPFPTKKRTSYERGSYTLPEFVQKNQGFQIWRNAFGDKNGTQAKQRVEAYFTHARVNRRYPFPTKKRTSHERGSYTLPEFVLKNQGFQIWRNAFGAKNGAQAKQRVEAYLTYARVFVIAQQLVFSPKAFAKSGDDFVQGVFY